MTSIPINFDGGEPNDTGLYVAYVDSDMPSAERILLMWMHGRWSYPFSDQFYRSHVYGRAGPLPVLPLED